MEAKTQCNSPPDGGACLSSLVRRAAGKGASDNAHSSPSPGAALEGDLQGASAEGLHEALLTLRPLEAELSLRVGRGLSLLSHPPCLSELGASSLKDVAREWLGVSPSSARDLMRLAEKLPELPGLRQALLSGLHSKSHVVELAKVATPEEDLGWVAAAVGMGIREVREMVRAAMGEEKREEVSFRVSVETKDAVIWGVDFVGRTEGRGVGVEAGVEAISG